jgi:predicted nucleotidyltransferase
MELKSNKGISIRYHDIFDYKLTKPEAIKWQYINQKVTVSGIKNKGRLQREKYSQAKLLLATKAAKIISKIPTVKFVGITGALAMNNAGRDSDIDLMIITSTDTLWLTRLCVYYSLFTNHYSLRRPKANKEKDMLCINLWLDEQDMKWSKADRNIYTAHEIAQIVPLVNKNNVYEKFLWQNRWILAYWPNAVQISSKQYVVSSMQKNILHSTSYILQLVEYLAFKLQYLYMKPKITREIVTLTRAIFHPNDWGKVVIKKLSS